MERPHKRLKLEGQRNEKESFEESMGDEDGIEDERNTYCKEGVLSEETNQKDGSVPSQEPQENNVVNSVNHKETEMANGKDGEDVERSSPKNEYDGSDFSDDEIPAMTAGEEEQRNAVQELKQFLVLDDLEQDNDKESQSDSESDYEGESEGVPDDEVEAMLDEGLPDDYRGGQKKKQIPYDQREKIFLEEKGVNHFEVLPLSWLAVTHNSGMPLYLHKPTRVCTMSKPYFLGPGSVRKHEIPVSAIPCLSYRRALLEEGKSELPLENGDKSETAADTGTSNLVNSNTDQGKEKCDETQSNETVCPFSKEIESEMQSQSLGMKMEDKRDGDAADKFKGDAFKNVVNPELLRKLVNSDKMEEGQVILGPLMPSARVETAQENWSTHHLRHQEVTDYCKKLFKFKSINIMRFKSWSDRRKFTKTRKALQRPTLPDGTKLITFPVHTPASGGTNGPSEDGLTLKKTARKECLMNPNGKSYVCILHEYVQRALKKQPTYEFKELENGATPYSATVSINGMRYGVGYGTSKRQAKSAAAKTSIEILIPEMRKKIAQDDEINGTTSRNNDQDLAFFDDIKIEDPRVADLCSKTMEPSPHTVLQTCLARNFGIGDREIKYTMNTLKHQRNEFTMTVGKHTATVVCKNKRDGKQRASQAILKALHPNITSWGSLLRLYGTRSIKSFKEKKQEEQEITLLQSRAAVNQPNYAILDKLRIEMAKLRDRDLEITPIGTMTMQEDLPTHSGSNLNNVDL